MRSPVGGDKRFTFEHLMLGRADEYRGENVGPVLKGREDYPAYRKLMGKTRHRGLPMSVRNKPADAPLERIPLPAAPEMTRAGGERFERPAPHGQRRKGWLSQRVSIGTNTKK